MNYTNHLIYSTLKLIPAQSLLRLDYVPAHGVRAEVAAGAALLGMSPTEYLVEVTSVDIGADGAPYFRGRCLNRGGAFRTFSPVKGVLRNIEIVRRGPATA